MVLRAIDCVQRTNIQNLKAIHNTMDWNAQQAEIVFKERIYKIWKQFTTWLKIWLTEYNCVQRTNIQNLKAIHNCTLIGSLCALIVFKERIYKIWKQFTTIAGAQSLANGLCSKNEYTKSESNSQQRHLEPKESRNCVQRTNIQNLKAIHNTGALALVSLLIVFKERIYKIWKQFTTGYLMVIGSVVLCSKNEYTKSESNSQLVSWILRDCLHCVQRTNIQNLKAIHNRWVQRYFRPWLCSKNEYTKSESNSQLMRPNR